MEIRIEKLYDNQKYIKTVVNWLYSEWGDGNYNFWDSWIRSSIAPEGIPQTYVAFVDGMIAGTYSLWRCDLQSRQDLFPWFGGLFVDQNFRGKTYNGAKLGEIMLNDSYDRLKNLGYTQVYLFTEKSADYYIRNGWNVICDAPDEKDRPVRLCVREIK